MNEREPKADFNLLEEIYREENQEERIQHHQKLDEKLQKDTPFDWRNESDVQAATYRMLCRNVEEWSHEQAAMASANMKKAKNQQDCYLNLLEDLESLLFLITPNYNPKAIRSLRMSILDKRYGSSSTPLDFKIEGSKSVKPMSRQIRGAMIYGLMCAIRDNPEFNLKPLGEQPNREDVLKYILEHFLVSSPDKKRELLSIWRNFQEETNEHRADLYNIPPKISLEFRKIIQKDGVYSAKNKIERMLSEWF